MTIESIKEDIQNAFDKLINGDVFRPKWALKAKLKILFENLRDKPGRYLGVLDLEPPEKKVTLKTHREQTFKFGVRKSDLETYLQESQSKKSDIKFEIETDRDYCRYPNLRNLNGIRERKIRLNGLYYEKDLIKLLTEQKTTLGKSPLSKQKEIEQVRLHEEILKKYITSIKASSYLKEINLFNIRKDIFSDDAAMQRTLGFEEYRKKKNIDESNTELEKVYNHGVNPYEIINNRDNRILIEADPGIGKTVLLKQIALELATKYEELGLIPILISLKEYERYLHNIPNANQNLLEFFVHHMSYKRKLCLKG